MMDVIEIVVDWLKQNGGIGLYRPGECGCGIDDLAPCGQIDGSCEMAAKVIKCDKHGDLYGSKSSDDFCEECKEDE